MQHAQVRREMHKFQSENWKGKHQLEKQAKIGRGEQLTSSHNIKSAWKSGLVSSDTA